MSDKYSIDDILAEIDRKRSSHKDDKPVESVTEIIGGNELDDLMRSSGMKTRMSDSELREKERAEEQSARERAEDIRRAAEKRTGESYSDDSEEEASRQRAENIRKAAERKAEQQRKKVEAEEKRRREREEKERLAEERRLEKLRQSAQEHEKEQREEEPAEPQTSIQFTPPTEPEPEEPQHTGFTGELSSPVEAAKLFAEPEVVQPQSEHVQPFVKPAVSGADDDIIFHTKSDLVTTETQKLRKLQRIEEINRALLAADRAAEEPDDLVDSLNPMESREKAVDELKNAAAPQEIGDTLAVSGNDLKKMSSGETEHVKEYSPVTSRKKPHSADEVLFTPGAQKKSDVSEKERRSGDALIASLNQKLKEQREKNIAEERTVTLTDISDPKSLPPKGLNLDYDKVIDTSILPKTDPVAAVQEAEALAARKKRRISSFMLEDIDDDEEQDETDNEDDEEEEDEVIDLDDENVITERLNRAGKGLTGRLVILGLLTAAALVTAAFFAFRIDGVPILSQLYKDVEVFLYTNLTIGILSFGACSSVITNGFSRLIKKKPDGDTLCGFAHLGALASIVVYLANPNFILMRQSYVYLIVSMLALCFNTVSKLCTVRAAKNNFSFITGDSEKFFVECTDGENAEQLARGAVRGFPVVASMRKTEMLCDFIISTYCEDISDRISRVFTPVILGLSAVGAVVGYFSAGAVNSTGSFTNQLSFAATVFSAILCVGASFTGALIVMLPMLSASRKTSERRAAILGYSAVEDFSAVNSVLVEAKTLFPSGSVSIRNIWDYNKNGTNGSQHVTIDEAIIYAASLAVSSDSILADPLFNMLNYKPALLKKVSNCVYESGLGVSGWIGSRRVLLGSRDHMKSHGIVVPDSKKESALNKNHDEVVYLAVAGEVCMLFFVTLSANPQVKKHVQKLADNGVSLILKTVDGALSEGVVSELFDIYAENVKILPAEAHEQFDEHTKYAGKGSAAVSCDGTFSSLASAINGAKALRERIRMGCIMEIAGIALGVLLIFIFSVFRNFSLLDGFWIAGYNAVWLILTALVMQFKRI